VEFKKRILSPKPAKILQANKKLVLRPSDGIVAIGTFEAANAPVV
jgi:hypothetical protein